MNSHRLYKLRHALLTICNIACGNICEGNVAKICDEIVQVALIIRTITTIALHDESIGRHHLLTICVLIHRISKRAIPVAVSDTQSIGAKETIIGLGNAFADAFAFV
jgi:hypothetical protein